MMYAYSVSTKRSVVVAGVALALVLAASAAWAAGGTVIETVSAWNGADGVEPFGEPTNATFGQTFTAPADNMMTSFTFFIDDFVNPDHVDFEAYVMAWDPDLFRATGRILWSDGPFTTTNNNGNGSYEQFTFDTRNLVLTAGAQYVAFLTASNLFDGSTGTSNWGAVPGDPYEDGVPVALDNGDDFSQVTSVTWLGPFPLDMAFEMTFDPSPRECPWDLDASGTVGASDLLALLASWGPCKGCPADFDGNGTVGAADLLALLANWGPCP